MLLVGFLLGMHAGAVLSVFPLILGQALQIYVGDKSKMKNQVGELCLVIVGVSLKVLIPINWLINPRIFM